MGSYFIGLLVAGVKVMSVLAGAVAAALWTVGQVSRCAIRAVVVDQPTKASRWITAQLKAEAVARGFSEVLSCAAVAQRQSPPSHKLDKWVRRPRSRCCGSIVCRTTNAVTPPEG